MTPNKRVDPTLDRSVASLPLRSVAVKRGSPLVLGVRWEP
jgi:hypothetical protein